MEVKSVNLLPGMEYGLLGETEVEMSQNSRKRKREGGAGPNSPPLGPRKKAVKLNSPGGYAQAARQDISASDKR